MIYETWWIVFYIVLWKGGSKRKNNRMVIQDDGMVVFVFVTLAHRIFFLATNSADLLLASLALHSFEQFTKRVPSNPGASKLNSEVECFDVLRWVTEWTVLAKAVRVEFGHDIFYLNACFLENLIIILNFKLLSIIFDRMGLLDLERQ